MKQGIVLILGIVSLIEVVVALATQVYIVYCVVIGKMPLITGVVCYLMIDFLADKIILKSNRVMRNYMKSEK